MLKSYNLRKGGFGRADIVAVFHFGPTTTTPLEGSPAIESPSGPTCPSNHTIAADGCNSGETPSKVSVLASSVTFGSVLFELQTVGGTLSAAVSRSGPTLTLGFGSLAARSALPGGAEVPMDGCTYLGPTTSQTALTVHDVLYVDVGPISTVGAGGSLRALGTGLYSRSTVSNPCRSARTARAVGIQGARYLRSGVQ